MDDDTRHYRAGQINEVLTSGDDESIYKIKLSSPLTSTKYMNITRSELLRINKILTVNAECDIHQISADGEDDGLTWFHCETHQRDTLSEQYCEDYHA